VLPVGLSDITREFSVEVFCPRCHETYHPRSSKHANLDGAYFGTTFCHLFLLTHPDLIVVQPTEKYCPRIFGFRINESSQYYRLRYLFYDYFLILIVNVSRLIPFFFCAALHCRDPTSHPKRKIANTPASPSSANAAAGGAASGVVPSIAATAASAGTGTGTASTKSNGNGSSAVSTNGNGGGSSNSNQKVPGTASPSRVAF
jgi:hypothetical protein